MPFPVMVAATLLVGCGLSLTISTAACICWKIEESDVFMPITLGENALGCQPLNFALVFS